MANTTKMKRENNIKKTVENYEKQITTVVPNTDEIDDSKVNSMILKFREAIKQNSIVKLSPNNILVNKNIRKKIDYDSIEFKQLVGSIKKHGVLQSIVVGFKEINEEEFELICVAGHRRLAALKQIGSDEKVSAKIVSFARQGATTDISLSENVNRKDLHFIELAETYHYLKDIEGLPIETISERYHKGSRTVERYIKMAKWGDEIKNIIMSDIELFPLKYIWDNFVLKVRKDSIMLTLLKRRLAQKESYSKENSPKKIGVKEKRVNKLNTYYKEFKVSDKSKEKIEHVLNYMGLI
ncbi:MAG: ParB/RepB/Spo0J family partition protein [Oligoflexales bacterium]